MILGPNFTVRDFEEISTLRMFEIFRFVLDFKLNFSIPRTCITHVNTIQLQENQTHLEHTSTFKATEIWELM